MLEEHEENRRISGNTSEVLILIIFDADLQMYDDTGSVRSL